MSRSAQGRKARVAGESFESRVNRYNGVIAAADIAAMDRMNIPTVPTRHRDGGKGAPLRRAVGRAPADFIGVTGRRFPRIGYGRSIVIECKHTSTARASLPISDVGVSREQLAFLVDRYQRWGAISLLLWSRDGLVGGCPSTLLEPFASDPAAKSIPALAFHWLPARSLAWNDLVAGWIEYGVIE